MQFRDFPSQSLPTWPLKPLERNPNLALSIVSTIDVLFAYHDFLSILDAGALGQMVWVQTMMGVQFYISVFRQVSVSVLC